MCVSPSVFLGPAASGSLGNLEIKILRSSSRITKSETLGVEFRNLISSLVILLPTRVWGSFMQWYTLNPWASLHFNRVKQMLMTWIIVEKLLYMEYRIQEHRRITVSDIHLIFLRQLWLTHVLVLLKIAFPFILESVPTGLINFMIALLIGLERL